MTQTELDELATLHATASAMPWHIMNTNAGFMSAVFVLKSPTKGRVYEPYGDEANPEDVVAACLLMEPDVASADDRCWDANAKLIATTRNALPELLRLARLGLIAETAESPAKLSSDV